MRHSTDACWCSRAAGWRGCRLAPQAGQEGLETRPVSGQPPAAHAVPLPSRLCPHRPTCHTPAANPPTLTPAPRAENDGSGAPIEKTCKFEFKTFVEGEVYVQALAGDQNNPLLTDLRTLQSQPVSLADT